jgi:hypothetical protein
MPHSTSPNSPEIQTGISFDLTEDEKTFLDDVPGGQVEEFLEYQKGHIWPRLWYFSTAYKVLGFKREQYDTVAAYFNYLKGLSTA